jgi:hypothetical protein
MKSMFAVAAVVLSLSPLSLCAADSVKITGWISDSTCGAKHAGSGKACVEGCIKGGMKPVFVDDTKKQVWSIDNPDSVKGFYGDHVAVTATSDATNKSVHIDEIAEAK